jgi:hypothetical protein
MTYLKLANHAVKLLLLTHFWHDKIKLLVLAKQSCIFFPFFSNSCLASTRIYRLHRGQ